MAKNQRKRRKNEKYSIRIGTWNIRSMLIPGKLEEIALQLKKYRLDITALQETRWKDYGQIDNNKYTLLHSGDKKQGRKGVAFIMTSKIRDNIIEFKPLNGRLAYVRIKSIPYNVSIINVYAPTEITEDREKEQFYEQLEEVIEQMPKHDTKLIIGDFNAKIGKETYLKEVAGKYTIHETTNDNGYRLCNLAIKTGMVIASTKYEHKKHHKITWMSPGQKYGNQIDHILVNKRREKIITDVRTYRGANADTDHYLVISDMKQKVIGSKKQSKLRFKWNVEKLNREEERQKYEDYIENQTSLEETSNEIKDINTRWKNVKLTLIKAAETQLGKKNTRQRNGWWNEECSNIIDKKTEARKKWIQTQKEEDRENYNIIRRESNKVIKKNKIKWLDDKMNEIEEESKNINSKKFYQKIKEQRKPKGPGIKGLKNKHGKAVESSEEAIMTWEEHFKEVLQDPVEQKYNVIENENDINIETPTLEEIKELIKRGKNGKATGSDSINSELIKYGIEKIHKEVHNLIIEIWNNEQMPTEWNSGVIVTIHKKGDKTSCKNYRGITLLNTTYKILTSMIQKRLLYYTKNIVGDYQCGFVRNKSTVDAIHILKQITEKTYEYKIDVEMLFIDFKQAFDKIKRDQLLAAMAEFKIPAKIRRLVQMTLSNTTAFVRTDYGDTKEFKTTRGVRQGDALSATLFNIALEYVLRKLNTKGSLRCKGSQIIAYADDLVVMTKRREIMESILKEIETEGRKIGLEINIEKTKFMKIGQRLKEKSVKIGENSFEVVNKIKYLGTVISDVRNKQEELQDKIQTANKAFYTNKKILSNKSIDKKTKIKIYKTMIKPILTYSAETVTLTQKEENKLQITERKIIRTIVGNVKTKENEVRPLMNYEIEKELEGENIVTTIKAMRIRWLGHLWRAGPKSKIREVVEWEPGRRRRKGRPKSTWIKEVEEDLKRIGIKNWKEKVYYRKIWREIVEKIKKSHT